jgi:hypothetical protein
MAKAKGSAAQDMGHNSGELTEAEEKALFFHHVRKDIAHLAAIKEAQDARKPDRKLAQADGFTLSDIDYAVKAMNADDKATVTDRYGMMGKVLYWLGLAPGHQPDLFVDRAPALERIEAEGERKGWIAAERVSPYASKSDEDAAWHRGYDRAQKAMADNLEAAMTKKNAANSTDELITGADADDPFGDEQREAAE